jgi:exodeoxyribonuclease VII small subunit
MTNSELLTYQEVKARLDEIVEAVQDEGLPLSSAIDLYEEAVSLGMRLSGMLEQDIVLNETPESDTEGVEGT